MYLHSKFNFAGLPSTAGTEMWRESDLIDLFLLSVTSDAANWFSQNVYRTPQKFFLDCVSSSARYQEHWMIKVDYPDGRSFIWYIYPYSTSITTGIMHLKIGNQRMWSMFKTENNGDRSLHSYLSNYEEGLLEIFEFLEKLFRSPITEINLAPRCHMGFPKFRAWERLKDVRTLFFDNCHDHKLFYSVLEERGKRGLTTQVDGLLDTDIIGIPPSTLTLQQLESIIFKKTGSVNLQHLSLDEILHFFKKVLDQNIGQIKALLPVFPSTELTRFKEHLNLADSNVIRRFGRRRFFMEDIGDRFQKFKLKNDDGSLLVFFFFSPNEKLESKPDDLPQEYNRITVQRWER